MSCTTTVTPQKQSFSVSTEACGFKIEGAEDKITSICAEGQPEVFKTKKPVVCVQPGQNIKVNFAEAEPLIIVSNDTLPPIANLPLPDTKVTLIVNGNTYLEGVHFTRNGVDMVWTFKKGTPEFGFTLRPIDCVSAYYRY